MFSASNSFKNLIESFNKMCCYLENDTEMRLKQISDDRLKELSLSAETLKHFDGLALNKSSGDNFLPMSYTIQADTVNCIKQLFNMPQLTKDYSTEKPEIDQRKLLTVLTASAEKNISDVKDAECIALELQDLL